MVAACGDEGLNRGPIAENGASGTNQGSAGAKVVDREDDPREVNENPCTDQPNDCPLREAINIAK